MNNATGDILQNLTSTQEGKLEDLEPETQGLLIVALGLGIEIVIELAIIILSHTDHDE